MYAPAASTHWNLKNCIKWSTIKTGEHQINCFFWRILYGMETHIIEMDWKETKKRQSIKSACMNMRSLNRFSLLFMSKHWTNKEYINIRVEQHEKHKIKLVSGIYVMLPGTVSKSLTFLSQVMFSVKKKKILWWMHILTEQHTKMKNVKMATKNNIVTLPFHFIDSFLFSVKGEQTTCKKRQNANFLAQMKQCQYSFAPSFIQMRFSTFDPAAVFFLVEW